MKKMKDFKIQVAGMFWIFLLNRHDHVHSSGVGAKARSVASIRLMTNVDIRQSTL